MSMNFREYIGTVKGQSPGADAVRGYYTQLKSTFASCLSQTDKTEQDFKELENFLNDIFFPKDNGDKKHSVIGGGKLFPTLKEGSHISVPLPLRQI